MGPSADERTDPRTPEQRAAQDRSDRKHLENAATQRAINDKLDMALICAEPACRRGRSCVGSTGRHPADMPPCFSTYREELRFLLAGPVGVLQIADALAGNARAFAEAPTTPGYVAWMERIGAGIAAFLVSGAKALPPSLELIYGRAGLRHLRRPSGVPGPNGHERDPDAFALYMAEGRWDRPPRAESLVLSPGTPPAWPRKRQPAPR